MNRQGEVVDLRKASPPPQAPRETGAIPPVRNQETETSAALLSWEAPEFEHQKKDRKTWINATVLIAGILLVIFLFLKNFLGMVVVLLGALTTLLYAFKEPRMMHFAITPKGILVGDTIHPFEELTSFWVFYDPPEMKEVIFRLNKFFASGLVVPLGDINPAEIRKILLEFLEEVEETPSLMDQLTRRIGF